MTKRPTIHAVAARSGVSTATVSKVVNRITAGVSESTRLRVEAAIRDLGYRPSRIGRGLRTLRRSIIGLAIVDPSPTFLADPFTTNLVAGLTNHLSSRGFGLLLHGVKPGELESSFLVRESEADALCVSLSGPRRARLGYLRLLARLGQPFVAFQDLPDRSVEDACFIRQDDRGGAEQLARHLMARRPRRATMIVSDVSWPAIEQRVIGIRKVLAANGVKLDLVACDETRTEAIIGAIERLVVRRRLPDVIIGQNDQIAVAAIQVLRRHGLRVPDDVAVSGFNAFQFTSFADPPLTTVRSQAYELGRLGAEVILERLETGRFRDRELVLPVSLV
ncbi:MAG: LacI family DNA-binding transcriptional regulator, partial [Rhodospirillaceae bacterium]|nr:LacI family DNA-binding transcriptional regulator [Rhodospirillaceae bacterium]